MAGSTQQVSSSSTAPAPSKWWHVPDEDLQDYVCTLLAPVAEAKVRGGDLKEGVPDAAWAKDALDKLIGPELEDEGSEQDYILGPQPIVQPPPTGKKPPNWKSWHVSDEVLDGVVRSLAQNGNLSMDSNAATGTSPVKKDRRRGSVAYVDQQRVNRAHALPNLSPSNRTKPGEMTSGLVDGSEYMVLYVYDTEAKHNVPLKVSADMHLGPAQTPKGNRFTDIWGPAASTAGFSEVKHEFDYRHRVWSDVPQKAMMPDWQVSLKSMIEEATGVPLEKQRLVYRGSPLSGNGVTLRNCGLYNGESIQLFRRKDPAKNDEIILASTRRALAKKAEEARKPKHHVRQLKASVQAGVQLVQPKWTHSAGNGKSAFTQVGKDSEHVLSKFAPEWGTTGVWARHESDRTCATSLERIRHSPVYIVPASGQITQK
mmetsp:Transcript_22858/g.52342  ORF Transcript_22858/g.52342 Transcript_22858/m.52342 type:complete len:427 (+) Transcript_22858:47-1327(+)